MSAPTTPLTDTRNLADVFRHFQARLASTGDALKREFTQLQQAQHKLYERDSNFGVGSSRTHEALNRYSDVTPLDATLFPPSRDASDYFNANLCDSAKAFGLPVSFVAHQAPVPATIPAFWHAVYSSRTPAIVMLTRLNEGGRRKADQYWPANEGESFELPNGLVVSNAGAHRGATPGANNELSFTSIVVGAKGERQHSLQQGGGSSDAHRTVLVRYEAWPDHGVPSTTASVQALIAEVEALVAASRSTTSGSGGSKPASGAATCPPVFVHCSAGVGRTGTFIGSYICKDLVRRGAFHPDKSAYDAVHWLKHQRPGSVQHAEQYAFMHRVLLAEIAACLPRSS